MVGARDTTMPGVAHSQPTDPAAYLEAVLAVVERIPPGRVMSYGAIAEYLHDEFGRGSARRVGTIMAQYGGAVPWHRVVNSSGRLPPGHETKARRCLEAEGVTFRGATVSMATYAWFPADR
jgi:methylated-DNA-protein-cysteine methyltransferase-like protein